MERVRARPADADVRAVVAAEGVVAAAADDAVVAALAAQVALGRGSPEDELGSVAAVGTPVTIAVTVIPLQLGSGFFWSTVIAVTSRSARDAETEFVAASAETSTSPHTAPTAA